MSQMTKATNKDTLPMVATKQMATDVRHLGAKIWEIEQAPQRSMRRDFLISELIKDVEAAAGVKATPDVLVDAGVPSHIVTAHWDAALSRLGR